MMQRIALPLGFVLVLATSAWAATSTTYPNMRQMQLGLKLIF